MPEDAPLKRTYDNLNKITHLEGRRLELSGVEDLDDIAHLSDSQVARLQLVISVRMYALARGIPGDIHDKKHTRTLDLLNLLAEQSTESPARRHMNADGTLSPPPPEE